tara:strand:+ start:3093 stop:3479 length:387 start_codon:yes stop_codon:yes gene_type:complete
MSLNKRIVLVNNYERLPNRWRMMLDTYGDGEELMNKLQRLQDDSLYCISVDNATGCIITSCLGIQCVDNPLKDTYMSIDELPEWVKGKIAVLNMVELIKDTNGQEYTEIVDGVGYRLGNTYYIGPLAR